MGAIKKTTPRWCRDCRLIFNCYPTETLEEIDEDKRGSVFVDAISHRILKLFDIDVRAMGYQVMPEGAKRLNDDLWLLDQPVLRTDKKDP